ELLSHNTPYQTLEVPVTREFKREVRDGVLDKKDILEQTKAAMDLIRESKPDRILTLGGECSVSVAPFSYLAEKYRDDVAMLWIDAHPDIGLPNDEYKGYHAMAVTHLLGLGDKDILKVLPASLESQNVLLGCVHSEEAKFYAKRQKKLGLKSLKAKEASSKKVLQWLQSTKASKVVIHLDLDVLDSNEIYVAVGNSGKLKMKQVTQIIESVSAHYEIVGFSIAELMPKELIRLQKLLSKLPFISQ
ncbi:MAG: arginase family protein, partial [Helicobacter japonicus]|nr:arginase family protein [Helicobacter japonicus]